jgi:A/G-specific adenine glycosylase
MHPLNESAKAVADRKGIALFRKRILSWFNKNKRRYPWRETRDPFKVLIAEMMLRRTKADQVKQVYEHLFSEYPDVEALANADEKKLEQILHPLGLKWRTPAFTLAAREVMKKYHGRVPEDREELTALPGVGDYVAGAVLSITYNKKEWIVDSNIVRLFRRYFGVKTTKEGRRDKHVIEMARIYASGRSPREANLAILDFSALICAPVKPGCETCPLKASCYYRCR